VVYVDSNRIKAVVDLHEYIETIGSDRPEMSKILKELGINPQTMWDCVTSTAHAATIAQPAYSIEITNYLFKLGVTIGYKYGVKKSMEESFGMGDTDGQVKD
jgi:hypothetical protein